MNNLETLEERFREKFSYYLANDYIPAGHIEEEMMSFIKEEIANLIPDYANADIQWENGEWVQYRSLHKLKPEILKHLKDNHD